MDLAFFESLSADEARVFLERFIVVEKANVKSMFQDCIIEGVPVDFSIQSVAPYLRWITKKVVTIPKPPDPDLPKWIRDTDSYTKKLFEFDDNSKLLILRAAYFFGESFVQSSGKLHWTIGDINTAEGNMPVVAGFQFGMELAPIWVVENLIGRVIADPTKMGDIERAVNCWKEFI